MKKSVIYIMLCGLVLLSTMNVVADENIDALKVGAGSYAMAETVSHDNAVNVEGKTIKTETEFITKDNITEMAQENISEIETDKPAIQESESEFTTEAEIILVPETETDIESKKQKVEDNVNKSVAVAKVGDTFKTYFGEFQILTVGENPTVAVIGDMRTDYNDNFLYGDTSKPWTVKYLEDDYTVTRISAHVPGLYITIPEGIEYIDNQVFKFDSTKSLILPSTLKHFDEDHALDNLESITVAEGNPYYKSNDNVLFTADGKKLLLYPAKDIRETYSTPVGTEEIVHGAFYKNSNLKSLDLANVKIIDKYSFSEMQKIEIVQFSNSLTNFDPNYTFYRCDTLKNIFVDKENKYFFDDNGVFYFKDDNRFGLICYPASHNLSSYTIPYGASSISQFAFSQTSVTSEVIIPATIGNIFTGAFIETKTAMDIVLQSSPIKSISQGAFEELYDGSRVIVPTEEIKNDIPKDAFLINYVIDDRIPIEVDYERAVSRRNNWYEKDGKKYYYNDNGELVHGICSIGTYNKYYFDTDGAQRMGFIDHEGKKYYFDPSYNGALFSSPGFSTISDKRYYFNNDNSLYLQRELREFGVTYYFDTNTGEVICDSDSHIFGSWSVTTPATCIQAGIEEHTCSKCQTKETKNLPKSDHSFGQWEVKQNSNCVIAGSEERGCTLCDNTEKRQLPLVPHKFSIWTINEIATCTKTGKRERKCEVCSFKDTEAIPESAHVTGSWVTTRAATCTSSGSRYLKCANCSNKMKTETLKASGHKTGAWVITKNPTCTKSGSRTAKCTKCGVTRKTESISAAGHSYGGWKTVTAAKVGAAGKKAKLCNNCGNSLYAVIPALKPISISKASIKGLKNLPYNGRYLAAVPTVKFGNNKLIKNKDYTLSYKNNKYPGKATVKISGKGTYSGYKSVSFYIVPKAPPSVNVKSIKKGSIAVKYNRATKASGYSISYAANRKFKGSKLITTSSLSKTISKLSSKRTYYVKVRSYITVNGKKYYGMYSPVKKIKVK